MSKSLVRGEGEGVCLFVLFCFLFFFVLFLCLFVFCYLAKDMASTHVKVYGSEMVQTYVWQVFYKVTVDQIPYCFIRLLLTRGGGVLCFKPDTQDIIHSFMSLNHEDFSSSLFMGWLFPCSFDGVGLYSFGGCFFFFLPEWFGQPYSVTLDDMYVGWLLNVPAACWCITGTDSFI